MGRAPCCSKVGLNRGPWTPEEDNLLNKYIDAHGEGNWRALPKAAGLLRCGKSCRLRWVNYLRPNVKRGNISEDEEDLIVMLHALLGNRWSLIAARMPGRTDNEIKNYWNTHLSKKLASKGLDPKTHKPIVSGNSSSSSKKDDSKPSSSSSSSCKVEEEGAWETTMDLDTCSYSTGTCIQPPPRTLEKPRKQRSSSKLRKLGDVSEPRSKQDYAQQQQLSIKVRKSSSLFACASPSSVFQFNSSPTDSISNSSDCSHTTTGTTQQWTRSSSYFEQPCSKNTNSSTGGVMTSLPVSIEQPQQHQHQQQQNETSHDSMLLQFLDDFLSSNSNSSSSGHSAACKDGFAEEDGAVDFWDSLGRIEPPSSSDLWELTDFGAASSAAAAAAAAAATTAVGTTQDIADLLFS